MTHNIVQKKDICGKKTRPEEESGAAVARDKKTQSSREVTQGSGISGAQSAKSFHESRFPLLE